jgi:hypothetical protein
VVTTNAGLTVTRASEGYAQREDGIWVNFASGALRRTDKGALIEGARTNRALHSRDLTQAAWTATNVTVARNQVGIDGLANTACSLTATAGNGTVLQAVTHASTARYFSVWIKRITGTGTVEVTLDNGSTWTAVTVTSAYTRVGAAQTLANPTVGVRLVTDTDAVAVDFAQLEDGAFPSSPIVTAGSSATRAADAVEATISYGGPVSTFVEYSAPRASNVAAYSDIYFALTSNSSTTRMILYNYNGGVGVFALNASNPSGDSWRAATFAADTTHKAAARWQTDDVRAAINGTLATGDTTAGAAPAGSLIRAGFGIPPGVGGQTFVLIRRAAIFPFALSDAQLQGITS